MSEAIDADAVRRAMMADLGVHRQYELPLSTQTRVASFTPASDNYAFSFDDKFKRNLGATWKPIQDEETERAAGLVPANPRPWAKPAPGSAAIPIKAPDPSSNGKSKKAIVKLTRSPGKQDTKQTEPGSPAMKIAPAALAVKKTSTGETAQILDVVPVEAPKLHTVYTEDCSLIPKSQETIQAAAARVRLAVDSQTNKAFIIFSSPNKEDNIGSVLDIDEPIIQSSPNMCLLINRKELIGKEGIRQVNVVVCFVSKEKAAYFKVVLETLQKSAKAYQSPENNDAAYLATVEPPAKTPVLIDLDDTSLESVNKAEHLAEFIYESVNSIRMQLKDLDADLTDYSVGSFGDTCFSMWARKDLSQVEESHELRPHLKVIMSFLSQLRLYPSKERTRREVKNEGNISSLAGLLSCDRSNSNVLRYSASEMISMRSKAIPLELESLSLPITIKREERWPGTVLAACPSVGTTDVSGMKENTNSGNFTTTDSFVSQGQLRGDKTPGFRGLATSQWAK